MDFDRIAEQRLAEAAEQGMFDGLPGAGRPLELEDLSRVPGELRAGYLMLKSAGCLPEEMQLKKELLHLRDLLAACVDEGEAQALRRRLTLGTLRFRMLMERRGGCGLGDYAGRLVDRLG